MQAFDASASALAWENVSEPARAEAFEKPATRKPWRKPELSVLAAEETAFNVAPGADSDLLS